MFENNPNANSDNEQKTGMVAVRDQVESLAWLAEKLGVTRGALTHWTDKIPAERVGEVSRFTGLAPNVLRPDIFKVPTEQPSE